MHDADPVDVEAAIVHSLLSMVTQDIATGGRRTAAQYQALFPGHADLIARELAALEDSPAERGERTIGPYVVRRELGRGGQAVVFLAHDPRLRRDVALKVLTREMTTLGAEQRLQREATVAARIDDSGICPVYEVGRDGEQLFLAMKYVPGRTLAAELAAARTRARDGEPCGTTLPPFASTLLLFETLAGSLARAHEVGIVHRDLKPANVMVGPQGPVLLDFGLAISLGDDQEPLTRTGDLFGTPHYLSPERLARSGHRGDERDDLWALAVTLYEALTLERPFTGATLELLYRSILTAEPARPSSLRPELPRDLDAVLATALARDPTRRYRTAGDFAADLRAVREGQPIRARPPGPWRRLCAWHRRHPAVAASSWLALVGATSTMTVQQFTLTEVRAARTEAADLNSFLIEKLLLGVTPDQARGETMTVAEVFDTARDKVTTSFPEPTRTAGTIHHVLGLANARLGRAREARAAMERAVEIRTQVLGPNDPATLESRSELIDLLRRTDDLRAAEAALAELAPLLLQQFGPNDRRSLSGRLHAVRLAKAAGRLDDFERLARAADDDCQSALGADDRTALEARHLFAQALELRGQRRAAEPILRDVVERRGRVQGKDAPAYVIALGDLASLLHDMAHRDGVVAKYAEAADVATTALTATERLHGKQSLAYAIALNTFASLAQERAQATKDLDAARSAVAMFRESLALREAIDGPRASTVALALGNLGTALFDVAEYGEAAAMQQRALALREELLGRDHPESVRTLFNLMLTQDKAKDRTALATRDDVVQRLARATSIDEKSVLAYRLGLVRVLWRFGRFDQAVREGTELHAACLSAWPGDGGPTGRGAAFYVAESYKYLKQPEQEAKWRAIAGPGR